MICNQLYLLLMKRYNFPIFMGFKVFYYLSDDLIDSYHKNKRPQVYACLHCYLQNSFR